MLRLVCKAYDIILAIIDAMSVVVKSVGLA